MWHSVRLSLFVREWNKKKKEKKFWIENPRDSSEIRDRGGPPRDRLTDDRFLASTLTNWNKHSVMSLLTATLLRSARTKRKWRRDELRIPIRSWKLSREINENGLDPAEIFDPSENTSRRLKSKASSILFRFVIYRKHDREFYNIFYRDNRKKTWEASHPPWSARIGRATNCGCSRIIILSDTRTASNKSFSFLPPDVRIAHSFSLFLASSVPCIPHRQTHRVTVMYVTWHVRNRVISELAARCRKQYFRAPEAYLPRDLVTGVYIFLVFFRIVQENMMIIILVRTWVREILINIEMTDGLKARAISCVFLQDRQAKHETTERPVTTKRSIERWTSKATRHLARVFEFFFLSRRATSRTLSRLPLIRARPFTLSDDIYLVSIYQRWRVSTL